MNKFMEILKPIALGILIFMAGLTTKVYVTVHNEKDKLLAPAPTLTDHQVNEMTFIVLESDIVKSTGGVQGIPVMNSNPKCLIYPEECVVTNYVRSKTCKICCCKVGESNGQKISCGELLVYPPKQCEYPIVATNIERTYVWKVCPKK